MDIRLIVVMNRTVSNIEYSGGILNELNVIL